MKIITWGINYAPEQTGIAPYNKDMCEHLAAAGHDVRMLTTFAYYPDWKKSTGDRGKLYRTDLLNGVRVHRCWHYVPIRPNTWTRMIHEGTFAVTSWLRLLVLPAPDVFIVVSPPLILGVAAWMICIIKRSRFVLHVQDMQPDAAVTLGLLKPGLFARLLYGFERFAYKRASMVSGITAGMLRMFAEKGVPKEKLLLFPNWARGSASAPVARGSFRKNHGISDSGFLAVYSGNLGKKQGLDILLDAARELSGIAGDSSSQSKAHNIRIVIAGNGVEATVLEKRILDENLSNARLLSLQPDQRYREMLADADVCLVTQQPGSGSLFFPSKLLTILAHGNPIVAVADPGGELEQAISEGGFGWCVEPGEPARLAALLAQLASDKGSLADCASNGSEWVSQFSPTRVLSAFEAAISSRFGA